MLGEAELGLHDLLEHGLSISRVERWQARDHLRAVQRDTKVRYTKRVKSFSAARSLLFLTHLVEQCAEGPPVDGAAVALPPQHLGGDVLGGTAEAVRACTHTHKSDTKYINYATLNFRNDTIGR